jgi:hypothetical protein
MCVSCIYCGGLPILPPVGFPASGGRSFSSDIKRPCGTLTFALTLSQHVCILHPPWQALALSVVHGCGITRHCVPSRIRANSFKTKDRRTCYPTLIEGVPQHRFRHLKPDTSHLKPAPKFSKIAQRRKNPDHPSRNPTPRSKWHRPPLRREA